MEIVGYSGGGGIGGLCWKKLDLEKKSGCLAMFAKVFEIVITIPIFGGSTDASVKDCV